MASESVTTPKDQLMPLAARDRVGLLIARSRAIVDLMGLANASAGDVPADASMGMAANAVDDMLAEVGSIIDGQPVVHEE